jgi:aryl-alcohol dehydrogenase-like predicted oxidoreductase
METRRFGRTGHMSTIAIFGGAAFWNISPADADTVMEMVIEAGINHIDVAPSYGQAEERLGPWMPRERGRFFLGCKTMERTRDGAWQELRSSLARLQTDMFDLYQCHAVNTLDELDAITMKGGALEALAEARQRGYIAAIGITGHGVDAPRIQLEALRRFEFDSVLFPLNSIQMRIPGFRQHVEELLAVCRARDVGTMIIKAITRAPWGERPHTATTWYEPFDQVDEIRRAVNFALSYEVTGLCTAGDTRLLAAMIEACNQVAPLDEAGKEAMIRSSQGYEPLFT